MNETKNGQLFLHYKNKPYKGIGVARHSETLEELMVYESLYDNDLGRLWVRPKDMYFSNIEKDGRLIRRFAPVESFVSIDVIETWPWTDSQLQDVSSIVREIFDIATVDKIKSETAKRGKPLLLIARRDGKLAGFKLGYGNGEVFESWLGGVLPEFRDLKIATTLMRKQHEVVQASGYKIVRTKTYHRWLPMLLMNLKNGFQIAATEPGRNGETKITLEKAL